MTEREKIETARSFLDRMAAGINPLSGAPIPDGELLRNPHISGCLSYVSEILGQVIGNGGTEEAPRRARREKKTPPAPFSIAPEAFADFPFRDAMTLSEICAEISARRREGTKKLTYTRVCAGLTALGILEEYFTADGRSRHRIAEAGRALGVFTERREGERSSYDVILYGRGAQSFVLDHLDAILAAAQR